MYSFKIYKEFTKEDKKFFLNNLPYSVFMEGEKIVLGLFKEKISESAHKYFKNDYIILGELNLEKTDDYSYDFYSKTMTIRFETESILETLTSLKPFFPLYLKGTIKDIRDDIFFLFDIEYGIINLLEESLRNKYDTDFSVFRLKGLESYDITNIFTYSLDCCAGISEYLKFKFDRYNEKVIDEKVASKALFDVLNKDFIEGGDEPLDESINFNLKKIEGFNNLYEVFKECYASHLREKDKEVLSRKGYNPYNYEERYKVITDTNKHEIFISDLENVLKEINVLDEIEMDNELMVFNCNETVDDGYELYKNTFVCFYNKFIIIFSNIFSY